MSTRIDYVSAESLRKSHMLSTNQLKEALVSGHVSACRIGNTTLINIASLNTWFAKIEKEQMAKFKKEEK